MSRKHFSIRVLDDSGSPTGKVPKALSWCRYLRSVAAVEQFLHTSGWELVSTNPELVHFRAQAALYQEPTWTCRIEQKLQNQRLQVTGDPG